MKKKIAVVSLIIATIAIVAFGTTLAWFMDTDNVKNVFTIGSIDIEQKETNADGSEFTQGQTLLPIVNTDAPSEDDNYIAKIATVTSTGKNDAYVRTFIAVPAAIKDILILDTADTTTKWVQDTITWPNVTVENVEYAVISFTYTDALAKDETTEAVLKGVYLDSAVDVKKNSEGVKQFCTKNADGTYTFYDFDITQLVNVLVATQGCQADGFENGAVDAINTAFGNTAPDFATVE